MLEALLSIPALVMVQTEHVAEEVADLDQCVAGSRGETFVGEQRFKRQRLPARLGEHLTTVIELETIKKDSNSPITLPGIKRVIRGGSSEFLRDFAVDVLWRLSFKERRQANQPPNDASNTPDIHWKFASVFSNLCGHSPPVPAERGLQVENSTVRPHVLSFSYSNCNIGRDRNQG